MKFEQVHTIGILGGGVMGGGIAQVLAVAGYDVVIRDLNDEVIQATRDAIFESRWGMKRAVEVGKLPFDRAVEAMPRISFSTDLQALKDVDFLIEAVPERLDLKQKVFAELDGIVNNDAIFVSNTSGFPIMDIARDVSASRKALFGGMHFSNPVPTMKMCEVISTPQTSQDTIEAIKGVAEKSGKVAIMVKDQPGSYGFILNRVFAAARREAEAIVDAGLATPEDVDRAMITGRNWPAGFFGERGGIGKQW
jgi:3-hydroxybutyryl-CoA dehydrogenase